jgi:hypothetical protein
MTGFLGHLVQRSLANRTTVRPRPVSLYEVSRPSPMPDPVQVPKFDLEMDSEAEAHVHSGPRPPVPRDGISQGGPLEVQARVAAAGPTRNAEAHPRREPEPSPTLQADVQTSAREQRTRAEPARSSAETTAGQDSVVHMRLEPLADVEAVWPATHPQSIEETGLLDADAQQGARPLQVRGKLAARPKAERPDAIAKTALPTPQYSVAPVQAVYPPGPTDMSVQEPDRSSEVRDDSPRHPERETKVAVTEAVLAPRLPQPVEPQPTRSSETKAEEPVIHVTIGRVEIRAVTAPVAQKRTALSKTALSLSDYLQRRNGGRV